MVDVLASGGEEGRSGLRKSTGSCERALIRRNPNGGTHLAKSQGPMAEYIGCEERTRGSETSQYLEEEKSNEILPVAASERGRAQTGGSDTAGVVGPQSTISCM
jgi:hypothetical protein